LFDLYADSLSGLIYGCYSREVVPKEKYLRQDIKPNSVSDEELRKFAGSIRKVDGEAEAHYKLALHFQEKYRHKLAIDELKQVLQRNPVHFKAYNALGVSFDNLGDHEAAIDSYKLALQIDPKLDYVYNNLGYAYLLKGDPQNAAEAFQQAIALNEKNATAAISVSFMSNRTSSRLPSSSSVHWTPRRMPRRRLPRL
jgi:tetratricopeptide (TPR) repeat protein